MNITILTDIPSPYQVEFFNAIDSEELFHLQVIYIYRAGKTRKWKSPEIPHLHCYIDEAWDKACSWVNQSDLVIFSSYRQRRSRQLIKIRQDTNKPWAFWGERPGVNFPGYIGKFYRRFMLASLYRSNIPVWGIGQWAVDGYMNEFGMTRRYFNVPYYSDLGRYFNINRAQGNDNRLRFLFSGQFIRRKGVDLLLLAFLQLLKEYPGIELHLLGGGELKNKLKETARDCNNVYFHGFRQWHELPAYYANADILCAPSIYDGWGLVVPEGMAAGMPVISTNRTGAALELIDQNNGWLIPAGNINELYSAMESAISLDNNKFSEMSGNARESSRNQHLDAGVGQFAKAVHGTFEACKANLHMN